MIRRQTNARRTFYKVMTHTILLMFFVGILAAIPNTAISQDAALEVKAPVKNAKSPPRALWVWTTELILKDSRKRNELLKFCKTENVDRIWVQLLYDVRDKPLDKSEAVCKIRLPHEFRRLIREAHEAGISVHALDGFPEFALTDYHRVPLAVMESLLLFNEDGKAEERFAGAHFDNEPYSIVGWQSKALRPQILTEFMLLNKRCKAIADRDPEFEFGIDIPVWWHQSGPDADQSIAQFSFDGETMSVAQHCMKHVDNIGIMNYRDTAAGPDGIIENGRSILEAAGEGGPQVLMGVETIEPLNVHAWFSTGLPREQFEEVAQDEDNDLVWRSRMNGVRLRTFDDGSNVHVGLEIKDMSIYDSDEFQAVMRTIVENFGPAGLTSEQVDACATQFLEKISANREFEKAKQRYSDVRGLEGQQRGILATSLMLPKITFGDNDREQFTSEIEQAEKAFTTFPAFGGTAIHAFDSASQLLKRE